MATNEQITLQLDQVRELATKALIGCNFSEEQAAAVAHTITRAERDGCESHGLFRVPFYAKATQHPGTNPKARPVLSEMSEAVVRVDAGSGFCPLALQTGLPALAEKAKKNGISALVINNAYNIAALWPEVEELAEKGLVAMAFTCANAYVAPAGGIKPLYGTNPMAFAWPRKGKPPMVFDQASSASARGEIQLHQRDGKPIPEGWAIDANGNPTTDPDEALAGAQLTFGGYKGAAIALMVELMAGALIGDLFSYQSTARDTAGSGAPFGGEFIIAINPKVCSAAGSSEGLVGADPLAHAEELFGQILMQDGTRLPGERRFKARERTESEGISIPVSLHETILSYIGA